MKLNSRTRLIGALTIAASLGLGLAACSSADGASEKKSDAPSASAAAAQYNDCVGDAVQVLVDGKGDGPVDVADCKGVNLISSDATYSLGATEVLTVEASNAKITVGKPGLKTLAILGSNNTVTYAGDAPQVDDQGEGNTVTAG